MLSSLMFRRILLKAWVVVSVADYPAAAACGPWVESTSAKRPCRECDWLRPIPNEVAQRKGEHYIHKGGEDYTWERLNANLRNIEALPSRAAQKSAMQSMSLNCLKFAYHPSHIPYLTPTECQPQDIMHLFLCGITRHELYYVLEFLVEHGALTWCKLNDVIGAARLPRGKRIPKVQPAPSDKAKGERHLDMTAAEVMTLAHLRRA